MRRPSSCSAAIAARVGAAGGRDVLDDHAAIRVIEERTLDAALQPVRLGVLAHEEGLRLAGAPRAGASQRGAGHRVRAHRQPAHGGGVPFGQLGGEQRPERREARGAQDRALCVHVVVRLPAARQRHLGRSRARARAARRRAAGARPPGRSYVRPARSPALLIYRRRNADPYRVVSLFAARAVRVVSIVVCVIAIAVLPAVRGRPDEHRLGPAAGSAQQQPQADRNQARSDQVVRERLPQHDRRNRRRSELAGRRHQLEPVGRAVAAPAVRPARVRLRARLPGTRDPGSLCSGGSAGARCRRDG